MVVRGDHGSGLQLRLRISGALLLAVSAGIHLDLYLTGYRKIPTIGWLFLLQVIAGFVLTIAALVTGRACRESPKRSSAPLPPGGRSGQRAGIGLLARSSRER